MACLPLLTFAGFYVWMHAPTNTIVTFADYYGKNPYEVNEITSSIQSKLKDDTYNKQEQDIVIKSIKKAFKYEEDAIHEAEQRRATIAIWGRYIKEKELLRISTIFELLKKPLVLSLSNTAERVGGSNGQDDWSKLDLYHDGLTLSEINIEHESKNPLSDELAYLTNFTSGLAHYKAEKWQSAINRFNMALQSL